jgi:hypothetical protein
VNDEANDSLDTANSKRIRRKGVYFGIFGITMIVRFIEYILMK